MAGDERRRVCRRAPEVGPFRFHPYDAVFNAVSVRPPRRSRALQKHGAGGGAFTNPGGKPAQISEAAHEIVDDILTAPGSTTTTRTHPRFGDITDVVSPDGVVFAMTPTATSSVFWSRRSDYRRHADDHSCG